MGAHGVLPGCSTRSESMGEIKLFERFCRCDWRCARWGGAVRRAGAFEVLENLADQLRVLNTGDDLQRPAAVLAGLDVDVEDALQALRPTHGHVPRGCPRLFLRRLCATELVPSPRVNLTRYHGVFAPNHCLRARIVPAHQRGQSRQKIQRLEYHVRRAIEPLDFLARLASLV